VHVLQTATTSNVAAWGSMCTPQRTLANGVSVVGLGIDLYYAYWADTEGRIWRVQLDGGAAQELTASVTLPPTAEYPHHLVVDETRVYWVVNTSNLWAIRKDGTSTGPLVPLVKGGVKLGAVTFDTNYLYFTDSGDGTIWRVAK
jgi:sugar lactone lactonase YvrE